MTVRAQEASVKRELLTWREDGLVELLRSVRRPRPPAEVDLRPAPEPQAVVPDAVRRLGLFLALTSVVGAGSVIGRGYAYSDVVALLALQIGTALLVWRIPWKRVDESWLVVVFGLQIVYVAALITLTGGGESPYFALYAPVLALAGWHLRRAHLFTALVFLGVTELWRVVAVERTTALDHVMISLPAFALLAILANGMSGRYLLTQVGSRRDQLRTARTLQVIRSVGELSADEPLGNLRGGIAGAFDADVEIAESGSDDEPLVRHDCPRPRSRQHLQGTMTVGDATLGQLLLCRGEPFSATERRLVAILADALGRALESRRLFAQVRFEAERDHLTGLLNRRAFDRDIATAVERAERADEAITLYFLDLDAFKGYNDLHGHAAGDLALQRIARALIVNVREHDRVYRFGGDEFVVISSEIEGMRALLLAERLRLASMARIGVERDFELTVSVGMATCRGTSCTRAGLLEEADRAMYQEKAERSAQFPAFPVVERPSASG